MGFFCFLTLLRDAFLGLLKVTLQIGLFLELYNCGHTHSLLNFSDPRVYCMDSVYPDNSGHQTPAFILFVWFFWGSSFIPKYFQSLKSWHRSLTFFPSLFLAFISFFLPSHIHVLGGLFPHISTNYNNNDSSISLVFTMYQELSTMCRLINLVFTTTLWGHCYWLITFSV